VTLYHRLDGPEDAPPLVFSNSIGTTLELWDLQMPAITPSFRVLRYDQLGHGRSDVPPGPYTVERLARELLALLDELEIERFSFCGLSLGGTVGMWLGAYASERLDRLVLAGTSAYFAPPERWIERAELVRAEGTEPIADATMGRWFTGAFAGTAPFREMLVGTPREGYAACCDALRDWDFRAALGGIYAPTLVLVGGEDPATPPAAAEAIADGIPGAGFTILGGAAHLLNVEQPDAFNEELLAHLAGAEGVRDVYHRGMEVRREVLGDEHVDRAIEGTTPFTADFQALITKYAWGEIWARPGLDRKTRSCMTLTALVALGRDHEIAMHVRAALRNGLTPDEIKEVLLQAAVYCGVPAANSAFAIAKQVLEEEGEA